MDPLFKIVECKSSGHAVAPVPAARKANNRTVVLLRTSPEDKSYAEEDGSTTVVNGTAKPVKKVEFCKTELHFAADSGKVNIVETDGKPPPTNKFRRRRRSHGLNAQQRQQQPGMPLVHFGDTSYEKYIFGGQGKPPPENATGKLSTEDNSTISAGAADESSVAVNNKTNTSSAGGDLDKKEPRDRIDAQNGHEDQETMRDFDFDGTWNRLRANHTTTVNFLNNESTSTATHNPDKSSSGLFSSQVALKDLDKYSKKEPVTTNPVLLKVLSGHKPILARLENDRGFNATFRNHLKKTKDDCDSKAKGYYRESLFGDRIPVYENIFDAISDGPLYENFNLAKNQKRANSSPEPRKKTTTTTGNQYDKKSATKKTTEVKPRAKSTSRSATPTIASEAKRTVPKSRDSSVKRYNGKVVAKDADTKRKSSLKSADSGTIKTVSSSNSDTLRKKKPVEVVYQTAVYNMKNEKLSKQSAKAKEAKGPRLINDLICGSKMKRPADKKVKATVGTQNTSKRKETSTMNR